MGLSLIKGRNWRRGSFLLVTIRDNRLGVPGGGLEVEAGAGGGGKQL